MLIKYSREKKGRGNFLYLVLLCLGNLTKGYSQKGSVKVEEPSEQSHWKRTPAQIAQRQLKGDHWIIFSGVKPTNESAKEISQKTMLTILTSQCKRGDAVCVSEQQKCITPQCSASQELRVTAKQAEPWERSRNRKKRASLVLETRFSQQFGCSQTRPWWWGRSKVKPRCQVSKARSDSARHNTRHSIP